jgi:hypothetical protein
VGVVGRRRRSKATRESFFWLILLQQNKTKEFFG